MEHVYLCAAMYHPVSMQIHWAVSLWRCRLDQHLLHFNIRKSDFQDSWPSTRPETPPMSDNICQPPLSEHWAKTVCCLWSTWSVPRVIKKSCWHIVQRLPVHMLCFCFLTITWCPVQRKRQQQTRPSCFSSLQMEWAHMWCNSKLQILMSEVNGMRNNVITCDSTTPL